VERARRAIRVFFLIRELSLLLAMEPETQLPLTNPQACVQVNNVLDLSKLPDTDCSFEINPLVYTVARETVGLARSVNTQPAVRQSEPSMSCF
jgi:hypothetical protein